MSSNDTLLEISNLQKFFSQSTGLVDSIVRRNREPIRAVDGVSLALEENEVYGIIGESGCGKSTLLKTLIGLEDITDGSVRFKGQDISEFSSSEWKEFRKSVQIIFQDPFNALNPKMTVRSALREPLNIHDIDDKEDRIWETLRDVELDPPDRYLDSYPGQLSGGEMQRVAIARALVLEPEVILADEPVSMLDVSTQSSILKLLSRLIDSYGVSMLYISHDLSTVAYVCDDLHVMYLGRIVESAPTLELLGEPKHPYSEALINAVPIPDPDSDRERTSLEGSTPDPIDIGGGCRFKDRCPERMDICEKPPMFVEVEDDRQVACHLYYDHDQLEATQQSGRLRDGDRASGVPVTERVSKSYGEGDGNE